MFFCRYYHADEEFLYYQLEYCGIPQVMGKLGFHSKDVIHKTKFLHQMSIDHFIEAVRAIELVEKKFSEQGLNLLAIACDYESKTKERTSSGVR